MNKPILKLEFLCATAEQAEIFLSEANDAFLTASEEYPKLISSSISENNTTSGEANESARTI